MGNACFNNTCNCIIKHFDICVDNNISNIKVEHSDIDEPQPNTQINRLKKYFMKSEKELSDDFYKKNLKVSGKKRRSSGFINLLLIDKNKYEEMLKKLLEQKNIERKGPKRRKTIRSSDTIKELVKEVINENNINEKIKFKRAASKKRTSLIIKNKDRVKTKNSTTLYRGSIDGSISINKIIKSQLKNGNSLNEILTDGNRSKGFNKKETNKI